MSENPYAADYSGGTSSGEPERTSVLAILSLVCSLICCIPGLSLLGVLLGIGALFGIGASGGRVGGKMLAIAGLVIGALVSFAWVGVGLAGAAGAKQAATLSDFIEYAQQDDVASASPIVSSTITEAQIIGFGDAVEAEWGAFVSRPQTLGEVVSAWMSMGQVPGAQGVLASVQGGSGAIPLTVEMADGTAVVVFLLDPAGTPGPSGMPAVSDVLMTTPDGGVIRLSDFGADGSPPTAEVPSDLDEPEGEDAETPDDDAGGP